MERETNAVNSNMASRSAPVTSSSLTDQLDDDVNEDTYVTTYTVVPPDGGWGWLVVASAFFCNMVSDGIIFNFGLVYLDTFVDTFHASKTQVSLVVSLLKSCSQVVGPLASALTNRYGFRRVAVLGGLISSLSFASCYFATSVTYLCFLYGVCAGIGSGMMFMASTLCLSFYFQRWRPLAVCLASCGSNMGGVVMGPILTSVYDKVGWRNTMLFKAGLLLLCSCLGLLYRPIKATKIKKKLLKESVVTIKNMDNVSTKSKMATTSRVFGPSNRAFPTVAEQIFQRSDMSIRSFGLITDTSMQSIRYPPTPGQMSTLSTAPELIAPWFEKNMRATGFETPFEASPPGQVNLHAAATHAQGQTKMRQRIKQLTDFLLCRRCQTHVGNRPLYRDDIFFDGSTIDLPQYCENKSDVTLNLALTRVATKKDIEEEESKQCLCCPEAVKRVLATMLDLSLFRSPSFILLLINCCLILFVQLIPFVYMPDRAKYNNMDPQVINKFVMTISMSGLTSKIVLGLVTSLPRVNLLLVYNCMITSGGIVMIVIGSTTKAVPQLIGCVLFGCSMASFNSLRSLVVVQLLGLEKLTNAFGLMQLMSGLAGACGPPFAGWFREVTHSYDAVFWLAGSIILLGGVVLYPVVWINRKEKDRNKANARTNAAKPIQKL